MVRHWQKERGVGWVRSAVINGTGALLCGVVTLIIGVTKFREGAWIVILLIPIIVAGFLAIHKRYEVAGRQLAIDNGEEVRPTRGRSPSSSSPASIGASSSAWSTPAR